MAARRKSDRRRVCLALANFINVSDRRGHGESPEDIRIARWYAMHNASHLPLFQDDNFAGLRLPSCVTALEVG